MYMKAENQYIADAHLNGKNFQPAVIRKTPSMPAKLEKKVVGNACPGNLLKSVRLSDSGSSNRHSHRIYRFLPGTAPFQGAE